MPHITLDVVSVDAAPLAEGRSYCFDGNGGTIGRDESNALVLPDKHRRVSRLHATVTFPGGVPTVANASTSLPLGIGDTQLTYGESMALSEGMLLEVGPYLLRVHTSVLGAPAEALTATSVGEAGVSMSVPVAVARPAVPAQGQLASTSALPTDTLNPPPMGHDPFAALLTGIGGPAAALSQPSIPSFEPHPDEGGFVGKALDRLPNPPGMVAPNDPFAALFNPVSRPESPDGRLLAPGSADPFAALIQSPAVQTGWPSEPAKKSGASASPFLIPEDFNPFDLPSQASRNSADPLASLLGGTQTDPLVSQREGEPSIDALFAPVGQSNSNEFWGGRGAVPSAPTGLDALLSSSAASDDPMDLFGGMGVMDAGQRPVRDDLAEIHGAFEPPRAHHPVVQSAASTFPAQQASAEALPGKVSSDALTQAFLKGANLPADALPSGLTPDIMRVVGGLLRNATAGAIDMLAARTATKLEVQASVTIISAQSNNPLKFLPNSDAALLQLLGKKMPGFMPADEAMRDAFEDLRAHEIGVIAGTRAALAEVLSRFDPSVLGSRLAGGSLLENLLPAMRKTKLWDIYLERYAQIRREAEDDFQSIFGRAFVQAYELETSRMKQASHQSKGAP